MGKSVFNSMNFVTDTHALLWWFTESPRLSPRAYEIFNKCETGEIIIFIPTIVIAEALSIFDKKRVLFDFKRLFKKIVESSNYVLVPLDVPILKRLIELKEIPELHDKIIVSTARYLSSPLITKDRTLQKISNLAIVW
jgi:PIN domain nuclease of toxin-antitoxin system